MVIMHHSVLVMVAVQALGMIILNFSANVDWPETKMMSLVDSILIITGMVLNGNLALLGITRDEWILFPIFEAIN